MRAWPAGRLPFGISTPSGSVEQIYPELYGIVFFTMAGPGTVWQAQLSISPQTYNVTAYQQF